MTDDDIEIANKIHYPNCWDDVAYPTLASALWELKMNEDEKTLGGLPMRQLWGDLLRLDVSRWFSHQLSYPLTVVWSRTFIVMKSDTRGAICDI